MTKIEITDEEEIARYVRFCKYEENLQKDQQIWRELKDFCGKVGYGSFTLTVKEGIPYKVDNPIQNIVLGIKTGNSFTILKK